MSPILSAVLMALLGLCLLIAKSRLIGFRSQRPADFVGKGPSLDPRTHLSGPILCEGVIIGPLGRVTSRFVAEMHGVWEGNRGILTERFRYDSGAVQNREWRLTVGIDGSLTAEASDVEGTATGRIEGPSVEMIYRLRMPRDAGGHVLNVRDWMYLMENGTIMNRSQFTKFGVTVGELVATMRRVAA
jgi:hypothetical protein